MRIPTIVVLAILLAGGTGAAFGQSSQLGPQKETVPGNPGAAPTITPSAPETHNPLVNPSAAGIQRRWHGWGASGESAARNGSTAAPQSGGSLTAAQARERLQELGYSRVSNLRQSQSGWRANAVKNKRQVTVALDPHGAIIGER